MKKLNWIIIVSNTALSEYKVPKYKSPWDNAWMLGTASNFSESIIYLIKLMIDSENGVGIMNLTLISRTMSSDDTNTKSMDKRIGSKVVKHGV